MDDRTIFEQRGYLLEIDLASPAFLRSLLLTEIASVLERGVDGAYVEPGRSIAGVCAAFEAAGHHVYSARRPRPDSAGCWQTTRPASRARERLRSTRSAEWLPTLPVA